MKRREFLKKAGAGAATAAVAAPAIAQQQPTITWRMPTSWPKSLDTLFGGAELIARRVGELTEGKFQIRAFAAGEIVPGLQVLDAVQAGTVEIGHTVMYYYIGKDPAFGLVSDIPFGMTSRQKNAWWYNGGGAELAAPLFKDYGCIALPAGNTGTQMGGWYRKEINTVADLKGLKYRIGGLAGQVLAKLGVVPQQLAGGDIYAALEKGTIDAAEWVGPYDDEKLGFAKVAKYYYYPAWWEGGPMIHTIVNEKKWAELPKHYKAALETACSEANERVLATYDAKNPDAMRRLVAGGTRLKPFSKPVMEACEKAAFEVYKELEEKSAHWKRIWPGWKKFRDDVFLWFRVAEATYENYVFASKVGAEPAAPAKGAKK
jgi:TRAP-type mannitol/chloroaromatic compound transport system substrate-binding protein